MLNLDDIAIIKAVETQNFSFSIIRLYDLSIQCNM